MLAVFEDSYIILPPL